MPSVYQRGKVVFRGTQELCAAFALGANFRLGGGVVVRQDTCQCGPDRVEIVDHSCDETFSPRHGCRTCDLWDGPPRLRKP